MLRVVVMLALLVGAPFAAAPVGASSSPSACEFRMGFKALHDEIPRFVGDCIENEYYAGNGDAVQRTTKGLMAWCKADNWTAFTNGFYTWINGPFGVWVRPNDSRFCWEPDAVPDACLTEPPFLVFTFE